MTRVHVVFFSSLRDCAHVERAEVEAPEGVTVADFLGILSERFPDIAPVLPIAVIAVNREHASLDTRITDGDEVALFPPVSGGGRKAGGRIIRK